MKRHRQRWTFDEVQQATQLRAALCSDAEIGEYLGRSAVGVAARLRAEAAALRRLDAAVRGDR